MKKNDVLFLTVTLFLIVAASIMLYLSFRQSGRATTEQIATITFKKKTAQRKYYNQPVWELLYKDSPVYNKDKIRTSDDSLSIIHLDDNVTLELDENTLIYLDMKDGKTNINFEEGSIYARNGTNGNFSIFSGETEINLNQGNAMLSRNNSDGTMNISVSEGSARVTTNGVETDINSNQIATIGNDTISIEDYPVMLKQPGQNSYIVTSSQSVTVSFLWESSDEVPYTLEISRDFNFSQIEYSHQPSSSSYSRSMEAGEYYWRILNDEGEEQSAVFKCTILHDYPVLPQSPDDGSVVTYFRNPPELHFLWNNSSIATGYRLDIAGDSGFTQIIDSFDVSSQSLTVDTLTKGEYFWRISNIYDLGNRPAFLTGPVRSFSIVQSDTVPSPRLSTPQDNRSVSRDYFEHNDFTFNWNQNNDIDAYTLEISESNDFSQNIREYETNDSFLSLDSSLPPGTYYWRITYFDPAQEEEVHTTPRQFTVSQDTTVEPVYPDNNQRTEDRQINLRWDDNSSWNRYRVQVSRDSSFSSTEEDFETSSNQSQITLNDEDTYYWRVHRLNPDGSERSVSPMASFTVTDDESSIHSVAFTMPQDGSSVNMDRQNSITFTWDSGVGPVRFELYTKEGQNPIYTKDLNTNTLVMDSLNLLDRGDFRAIITSPQAGGVIGETEFTITLTPLARPVLQTRHILLPEE